MSTQKRFITKEDALSLLDRCTYGILSTASPDGEPYGVPVNYCYLKDENCIFFHCALSGRKIDNIKSNSKVSFTVVGFEKVVPEKVTTYYESVLVFGRAKFVSEAEEKTEKLKILCKKFAPDFKDADQVIAKQLPATAIIKIHIDSVTGKRNNGQA